MAVFKCKICGGSLDIADGSSIAVCDYCGTKQTVPTTKDDVVANLFNRANNLRLKCEFDKAEQVYEKILDIDNTDAEAHWGMVLCKYGIEYVEDKKTDSKIPTCHRTLYEAILTDVDYLATIENADTAQKELYESEALVIDGLQKNILNIVNNEEPFDVFICYKETDEAGKRTIDSSIANDIYYHLTQEGFKVFYAPITLENKLGYEYEPYIFAALNSAKVMLVVGTKPEHFNAVWVRNEWSRYLKLIKSERSKLLIPCYKDMDAYELPDEFAHLQAQDMSKIGFIQDLLRGINKLISSSKPQSTIVKETVVHNADSNITPLLKRVFIFLEDEDWNSAEEYCEKVLDINPECAEAYIGKLMVELKVKTRNGLKNCRESFENSANYQKVIRFADDSVVSELKEYISHIKDRNTRKAKEDYNESRYLQALSEYKTEDIQRLNNAIKLFTEIIGWKDSKELIKLCQAKIAQVRFKEENEQIAKEKTRKRNRKTAIIATPIVVLVITFVIVLNTVIIPNSKYNAAIALMNEEKFDEAITAFELLWGYKDSNQQIITCKNSIIENKYQSGLAAEVDENFREAMNIYTSIMDYKDSCDRYDSCFIKLYGQLLFDIQGMWHDEISHSGKNLCVLISITENQIKKQNHITSSDALFPMHHSSNITVKDNKIWDNSKFGDTVKRSYELIGNTLVETGYFESGRTTTNTFYRTSSETFD